MMKSYRFGMDRREMIRATAAAGAGLAIAGTCAARSHLADSHSSYRFCLNMSTIRGQNLTPDKQIEVAAKAGYDAIEPWMRELHQYVEQGGSVRDLKKRLNDNGLTVESAIGFARWIVDDNDQRAAGFEEARRDMDLIARLGGTRIAAPPAGVRRDQKIDLLKVAQRYRELLDLGDQIGVIPQVEMWGGNSTIGRVSDAIFVAVESGHQKACFLGDVYHTYKGGSAFDSLKLLSPQALQVFHFNDYPADPPREAIKDEHRVYPGDGIAPLTQILNNFRSVGATPVLSLELFNRTYWQQDAFDVAQTGLEKMKQSVALANG